MNELFNVKQSYEKEITTMAKIPNEIEMKVNVKTVSEEKKSEKLITVIGSVVTIIGSTLLLAGGAIQPSDWKTAMVAGAGIIMSYILGRSLKKGLGDNMIGKVIQKIVDQDNK